LLGIFQALFFSFIGALLQNFAGEGFGGGFDSMSLATPFFMIVFTAIFFAIFNSFIIGIVLLFYNVVSQWIGGVRIELEEDSNYVTLREMDE